MNRRWVALPVASILVASALATGLAPPASAAPCDPGNSPVVCENSKPGSPASEWEIQGNGDPGLQGFATKFSVNVGDTEQFKIKTTASTYSVDIYRLGWYGGDGARKVASVTPTARTQPNCITESTTGLVDCGNWAVSASWAVPSDAVSGVYIAHLNNPANQDESQITFVVRNDASHSDIAFQTSDSTWQAYNTYGGSDFYTGVPDSRAYKLSYNRPFNTRGSSSGRDFLFSNEFPMLQFLERNGYDVSYLGSLDTDRRGSLLLNHKTFVSTGHDEYWSGQQRTNVEAARDAGVNLAFFSGNEVYWKTRWAPSIDGTATDGRTLVCYKETWASAKIDPTSAWTGTWRDPRFSPPADGGRPENGLTGTAYMSNFTDLPITVSEREGKLRLWRNTSLATLTVGASAALADHTIGYESDEDLDNGYRPEGLVRLSTTTGPAPQYLTDYGNTVEPGTTTHHLTEYRAGSGALVFGAGTIQWAWGLSQDHDGDGPAADPRIQQATINILADMGARPATVMSGLVASTPSADNQAPTTVITSPAAGTTLANGTTITVTGSAADSGGGRVAGVEVSTDGGSTWHPATGQGSWTYTFTVSGLGAVSLKARSIDDSANIGSPGSAAVTVACPCSLFGERIPATPAVSDTSGVEVGVQFVPADSGYITGIRFYKGTGNTGTHTGSLWTASGTLLASGTFSGESATGWQTLQLSESVPVDGGTTYVASYFAPNGHYAADSRFFDAKDFSAPPLSAKGRPSGVSNGVYSTAHGFPSATYGNTNYYVDVQFTVDDTTPPVVTGKAPLSGSTSVPITSKPRAVFSRVITQSSLTFTLTDASNASVPGAVAYDATTRAATFTPTNPLVRGGTYTVTVSASSDSGVPMTAPATWSFTTALTDPLPGSCPCSIWTDDTVPDVASVSDTGNVQLGVKFTADVDGEIAGIKFYKGQGNVGTHIGSLWTSAGTQLASATFVDESTTGWQTVLFSTPVAVTANTTYLASYRAPVGGYAATSNGLGSPVDSGPLHTLQGGAVYTYGTGLPTSISSTNYWVDVVYNARDAAPAVASTSPGSDASNVPVGQVLSASLTGQIQPGTPKLALMDAANAVVPGTSSYAATSKTVSFTPNAPLAPGTTYTATASGATALSGAVMSPYSWSFTTAGPTACPCTLFESTATPATIDSGDASAITVGVKFTPSVTSYAVGVRFYKSAANTGTHTVSIWSSVGVRLGTATVTGESASGWQTALFDQPVQLTSGQQYTASYSTPSGHYSATGGFFAAPWSNGILDAPANAGTYRYGSDGFPTDTYNAANYWVDPIVQRGSAPDTSAPSVQSGSPVAGATSVDVAVKPTAVFSEDISASSLTMTLKTSAGTAVAASSAYDSATRTATLSPNADLARGATYTVTVSASDPAGNAMTPVARNFTTAQPSPQPGVCPCSLWDDAATPAVITVNDPATVELGVKFSADTDGSITGVRFYKGPENVGSHTGSLWSTDGTRLATGTFTGESSTGWQTLQLASPAAVTAGTTYVASYLTSGYYSATGGGVAAIEKAPLHTGANPGVYVYGGGYPTNPSSANYWVDPVLTSAAPVADTTAPVVSAVTANPGANGTTATVTWTTDESATSVVQFGATASLGSSAAGTSGTSHSVTLSGLTDGTTYYYRVVSADAAGNSTSDPVASTAPRTFATPDVTPPAISAVAAAVTASGATVTWTTNESATSSVSYGTTTALGSTATGSAGTSHLVAINGLASGYYYYRVTSADSAGNSTTDPATSNAQRSFVIADTTAPTISAVAASGSGTTATATWTTDESATTSVSYGTTTALGSTATGTSGTEHSVTLSGLTVNTRYYYRVTSADAAGNSTTSPAAASAPASYVPTVAPITQTTVADFSTGTGGYVSDTSGGEVLGSVTLGSEFTGTTTPTGFTSAALVTGGATTYSSGQASLSGSRLYTGTYASGRSFASAATMGVGQTLGWGSIASGSTAITAAFVTDAAGALSARVNDGAANNRTIAIPGTWTGAKHEYRIDWPAGNAVFFIDGTQVATSAFSTGLSLRVIASDPTTAAPVLTLDWVRVAPYAASATFTSAVIDAGASVGWDTLVRDVDLPSGTTMTIQVRSGPNANTGSGAWTGWTTVSATTNSITRSARYLQYRLVFTTSGTRFASPTVRSIVLGYHVS